MLRRLALLPLAALLLLPVVAPAPAVLAPTPADLAVTGRWGAPFDGQVPAVSMALLHDGRVIYWSGVETTAPHDEDMTFFTSTPNDADWRVLDLRSGTPVVTRPGGDTAGDLFCSGLTFLPDGRLLAAGATKYTVLPESTDVLWGLKHARTFDPATNRWERVADMANGRWYPSLITLPSGDALVASGISNLTNPITLVEAEERYDLDDGQWHAAGSQLLPMYPRLAVVPSGPMKGKVFYSTNGALWGPFGEHPLEALWSFQHVYDPSTGTWQMLGPSVLGARQHAATVMLALRPDDGYRARMLTFGGTLQRSIAGVPFAEVADLSTSPPTNRLVAPMSAGRWHLNGVLLPTGGVLAIGGGAYDNVVVHGQPNPPVLSAELFDPATEAWRTLAAMQVPRMYHSTAILLPDARVLVAGHVPLPVPFKTVRDDPLLSSTPFSQQQVRETRFEVLDPPYLFQGARPSIVSAPASVGYGEAFDVATPDHQSKAVLVRPGATTHSFDSEQRAVELRVAAHTPTGIRFAAPPDADVAPPGHYMLFLVNNGVPSVARFVHLA